MPSFRFISHCGRATPAERCLYGDSQRDWRNNISLSAAVHSFSIKSSFARVFYFLFPSCFLSSKLSLNVSGGVAEAIRNYRRNGNRRGWKSTYADAEQAFLVLQS